MRVVDASVFVDALMSADRPGEAARAELRSLSAVQVPAIQLAEVASALRAMVQRGLISTVRGETALRQARAVRRIEHPFEPFAARVWQLRNNLAVYDAWYVALAEALGAELITADQRLLNASGPRCPVRAPEGR